MIALNIMRILVFLGIWSIVRFVYLKAFVWWQWSDTFAGLLKTQFNRSCSIAIMAIPISRALPINNKLLKAQMIPFSAGGKREWWENRWNWYVREYYQCSKCQRDEVRWPFRAREKRKKKKKQIQKMQTNINTHTSNIECRNTYNLYLFTHLCIWDNIDLSIS